MAKTTNKGSGLPSMVLGLALLSLVFLGSPGCGCGDDDLPRGEERPERCCCEFEWVPPTSLVNADVRIDFENVDVSLDPTASPGVIVNAGAGQPRLFTICVNEEHLIGDSFELVLVDDDTNTEYDRYELFYNVRCEPGIEPLGGLGGFLTSTDCGEPQTKPCCCEFEWLPGPNQVGDVTVNAENASAGLNPVITPSALTGVGPDALEVFDVCVSTNHPIGAQFDLVIRQQGSGAIVGTVQLVYDEQCTPTVVPVTSAPTLDVTSTDCGGDPLLCCCEFDWLPGPNDDGDVSLTTTNVSPGLTVQITPSTLTGVSPRVFESFTVCINADHNLLDSFDLVVTRTSDNQEFGRARIVYRLRCEPDIGDVPGTTSLALTSTDCGGDPLQCCCDIEWLSPTSPAFAQIFASLENVGATLETATVTPTQVDNLPAGNTQVFTVCVNPGHTLNETLDLVLRAATGAEIARLPLLYADPCIPEAGDPSGEGFWTVLCTQVAKPGR